LKFPAFTLPNFPALFCAYCHFAPPGGGSGAVYGVSGHKKSPGGLIVRRGLGVLFIGGLVVF
jgi:hypothetical protein